MRGHLISLCMSLMTSCAFSASILKGVVLLNTSSGPPVSNVQISTRDASASPQASGSLGTFELQFPQRNPGDTVVLVVRREGYAVVNDIQLERDLPRDPSGRVALVVLSRSQERDKYAELYYRVKGREAVDEFYRERIAQLGGQVQQIEQVRMERDRAILQADELAKQLARYTDELGITYKRAAKLFLDRRIDQALEMLSEDLLEKDAKVAVAAANRAANNYILKARLLALKFRWEDAATAYDRAVKLAPERFDSWVEYSRFHFNQNDLRKAESGYMSARELAVKNSDACRIAFVQNNLGIIHRKTKRFDEALNLHTSTLGMRRTLALHNASFIPQVALSLNNISVVHWSMGHPEDSLASLEEAIAIWRSFPGDRYAPDLAASLNNRGLNLRVLKRYDEARTSYSESLQIRRKLAALDSDTFRGDVAATLNNLGALELALSRADKAEPWLTEAANIRRVLAGRNIAAQRPEMMLTLINLGIALGSSGKYSSARSALHEALTIGMALSASEPKLYGDTVVDTLHRQMAVELMAGDASSVARSASSIERACENFGFNTEACYSARRSSCSMGITCETPDREIVSKSRPFGPFGAEIGGYGREFPSQRALDASFTAIRRAPVDATPIDEPSAVDCP